MEQHPTGDKQESIEPLSIRDLAEGIRQGSEDAFNQFYDLYADRLYRYLLVIVPRDEGMVREALQETLFRVLRYIKPLPCEQVLWCWLTRVARSVLIDLLRRRRKGARLDGMPLDERIIPLYPREEDSDRELLAALHQVLPRLPEEERLLIEAHYIQGIRQSDLARQLGTTTKAVESRLARLRRKMKPMILEALAHDA